MPKSALVKAGTTKDIPLGKVKVVRLKGRNIAIANVDGTFHAIDDVCTHDGGPLDQGDLEGEEIECPRHGARFSVVTGAALCFPAVTPVRTYPVSVQNNFIYLDFDEVI